MTLTLVPDFTGLGHREVSVGGGASYLPLEFTAGQPYSEQFEFLDGNQDSTLPMTARFKAGPPQQKQMVSLPVAYGSTGLLELEVDGSITAQLFALAQMDREPVAEWQLDVDRPTATPATTDAIYDVTYDQSAQTVSILARGPVFFRRRSREPHWLQVDNNNDTTARIILRGEPKGEYQDGISYKKGDLVTMGGKNYIALCDTDGSPGSGPSADPSDPDSNTLYPEFFPPGSVTADDATAPADGTATATATAGGTV